MFSEKLSSWKNIIAGFGIFGFILSLITGLIGDVAFSAVILRALLFAVLFAAAGLLILKVIETFLPELLDTSSEDEDEISDTVEIVENDDEGYTNVGKSGQNLDITIEDDDELEPAEANDKSEDVSDFESADAEDEPEELEELGGDAESDASPKPKSDSESEAVSEAEPAKTTAEGKSKGDLPDIGEFSDSFEEVAVSSESEGLSNIDGFGGSSGSAEILGGMHETQEIVKAVKSVLKKDQEG